MDISTTITDLIRKRYSCRSYEKKIIQAELREMLQEFCSKHSVGPLGGTARFELIAGSENDLQALKGLGTYGFISGATGFIVGAISNSGEHLEDFGYLLEKIILYATGLGLGTCWLGGTFTKSSFAKKIDTRSDELVPSVSAVGYPAKKPRLIESVIRGGAKSHKRLSWDSIFFKDDFYSPISKEGAKKYGKALEMVRLGPSASNRQPWRIINSGNDWHLYLQRTPGYKENRMTKLTTVADLQRIDIGIAMCHFGLTAEHLQINGSWIRKDPGLDMPNEYTEYVATWIEDVDTP